MRSLDGTAERKGRASGTPSLVYTPGLRLFHLRPDPPRPVAAHRDAQRGRAAVPMAASLTSGVRLVTPLSETPRGPTTRSHTDT